MSRRSRSYNAYFRAVKKLIASIYLDEDDLFRFSTRREYVTGSKRKQVWLTPKTLTLFITMRDLGFVETVQEAVASHRMKKKQQQSSETQVLTAVYRATEAFHTLLHNVTSPDIEIDISQPRVDLKTAGRSVGQLTEGYLNSSSKLCPILITLTQCSSGRTLQQCLGQRQRNASLQRPYKIGSCVGMRF